MENQPTSQPAATGRQWFRLASLARLEALGQAAPQAQPTTAPAPAPAPAPTTMPARPVQSPVPRIPLAQSEPTQAQSQLPRPPTPPTQQAPPPSTTNGAATIQARPQTPRGPEATPAPLPAESSQAPVAQALQETASPSPRFRVPSRAPTPQQSPRVVKPSPSTPPESPTIREPKPAKALTPYPEPEPELKPSPAPGPKNMYMQQANDYVGVKTIADISGMPSANGNQSHSNARAPPPSPKKATALNGRGTANGNQSHSNAWKKDEDGEFKVITMAGENMGAYMELASARGQKQQQQHGHKLQDLTKGGGTLGEDGKSEDKKKDNGKKSNKKPTTAMVNSNVQSVNNSIIFRSSCTQQSPGVHMRLVREQQPKQK